MTTRRIPKVPDTPAALSKYATKATVGEAERARIGCTLLLASKLAELSGTASQLLNVTIKSQPAPGPSLQLVRSLEHELGEAQRGSEADANRLAELHSERNELQRERGALESERNTLQGVVVKHESRIALLVKTCDELRFLRTEMETRLANIRTVVDVTRPSSIGKRVLQVLNDGAES